MDYKGLKVAITGGTGFIGAHVRSTLHVLGCDITALVRDDNIRELRTKQVRGDIRDADAIERLYFESDPDLVLHFAAVAPVGHAYKAPYHAIEVNTMGTATLLEVHRRLCPDIPVILASSDKAYGSVDHPRPLTEDDMPNCSHPYDASKYAADIIAMAYTRAYGLKTYIMRYVNVYGPGDTHFNRLIPYALRCALFNEKVILRTDGSPVRHYLFIDDIVRAYLRAIKGIFKGRLEAGIYNISHERTSKSVLEILAAVDKVLGTKLLYDSVTNPASKHETDYLLVSGSKFMKATHWAPTVSLEKGLESTTDWMRTYLDIDIGIEEKYKR